MITTDTRKKIELALGGDINAFAEVFESLRPKVFTIAARLAGVDDADDVVMETYLKAWHALPRFNRRATLTTWLYRITHNCALDFIRSRNRHRKHTVAEDEMANRDLSELADADAATPAEKMIKKEEASIVGDLLGRLDPMHRATLLLRYSDGLSYREIAAATGVSIGTVMSRLFNGKRKLRNLMTHVE